MQDTEEKEACSYYGVKRKADRDQVQKFKSFWEFRKLHSVHFSIRNNTRIELFAYVSEKTPEILSHIALQLKEVFLCHY